MNSNVKETVTVAELAEELGVEVAGLGPLLEKMGMRGEITPDKVVPLAIATNARKATQKAAALKALPGGKSGGGIETPSAPQNRELKKQEIREIASELGLTQTVVKQLDTMVHDHACQVAFLEGYQEQVRKEQELTAFESGKTIAELKTIQERDKRLTERESALIEEGTRDYNPTAFANMLGIDLVSILDKVEQESNQKAASELAFQEQQASAERSRDEQSDIGLDAVKEMGNPFMWLQKKRAAGR